MPSLKIKKGDRVVVLTGRDKGKRGEVVAVMPKESRALVRGVNIVRRHQRQTASQEGGIISKEAPIQQTASVMEACSRNTAEALRTVVAAGAGSSRRTIARRSAPLAARWDASLVTSVRMAASVAPPK